jgi:hypothetical protein
LQYAYWTGPGYYPKSKLIVPSEQPVTGVEVGVSNVR